MHTQYIEKMHPLTQGRTKPFKVHQYNNSSHYISIQKYAITS